MNWTIEKKHREVSSIFFATEKRWKKQVFTREMREKEYLLTLRELWGNYKFGAVR